MPLSSSQESLPLSQETYAVLWNAIPEDVQKELINVNLGNLPLDISNVDTYEATSSEQVENLMSYIGIANTLSIPHQSSLPATENFPGRFNFGVSIPASEWYSKKSPFVYSTTSNKLYVKRDRPCPFNFTTNVQLNNFQIRAVLYFSTPEHVAEVVERCVNDKNADREKGDLLCEHILRCESQSAHYYKDSDKQRCHVTVPYEKPPIGQDYSTYLYSFTCWSSCSGGPNRRPMCVVFTLEKDGIIYGRGKINLKICSCPLRDKNSEQNNEQTETNETTALFNLPFNNSNTKKSGEIVKPGTKRKHDENADKKCYNIAVYDERCYKILLAVKKYYEICNIFNKGNFTPTVSNMADILKVLTSSDEDKES